MTTTTRYGRILLPNGYSASVIADGPDGFEVGIIGPDGQMAYGTPVSPWDAVVRCIDAADARDVIARIAALVDDEEPEPDYAQMVEDRHPDPGTDVW